MKRLATVRMLDPHLTTVDRQTAEAIRRLLRASDRKTARQRTERQNLLWGPQVEESSTCLFGRPSPALAGGA